MNSNSFVVEKRPHESGNKHVSGHANYIDDIIEPEGTLYGAIGYSKKANAIIKKIKVAYGGMANIPKRAVNCEKILLNSTLSDSIINKAKKSLEKDFKPITDARASQKYRMEIAKNLLEKCFLEIKQKKLIRINI